ncbi:conserved hypothetical protein [Vibrio coralliirubri]|nr:conserved hypothetical protein [Vibrio coralliirubri]
MGICAYCKEDKKLTREHIIPDFMYKFQNQHSTNVGWNEKAQKVLSSEGKIKDVCAQCNNVELSDLDGFAKNMLSSSGIMTLNYLSTTVTLNYDYEFLKRWLLKLSFNSARAASNKPEVFERFIPYILGKTSKCTDVHLLIGLYKPEQLSDDELTNLSQEYGLSSDMRKFNPFHCRISWMPQYSPFYRIRIVVLGALLFKIVIFEQGLEVGYQKAEMRKLTKTFPGMKVVPNKLKVFSLSQMDLTFVDTQMFQFARMQQLGALDHFD